MQESLPWIVYVQSEFWRADIKEKSYIGVRGVIDKEDVIIEDDLLARLHLEESWNVEYHWEGCHNDNVEGTGVQTAKLKQAFIKI